MPNVYERMSVSEALLTIGDFEGRTTAFGLREWNALFGLPGQMGIIIGQRRNNYDKLNKWRK